MVILLAMLNFRSYLTSYFVRTIISSSEFWSIIPSLMQAWIRYYIPSLLVCLAAFANNSFNLLVSLRSNDYCYEPSSIIYSQRLQSLKHVLVVMMHTSAAGVDRIDIDCQACLNRLQIGQPRKMEHSYIDYQYHLRVIFKYFCSECNEAYFC